MENRIQNSGVRAASAARTSVKGRRPVLRRRWGKHSQGQRLAGCRAIPEIELELECEPEAEPQMAEVL